eukprot:7768484-Prorocentrum_lima.AAC.1
MDLSLPTTFPSSSSSGTHVHGSSVRRIDFVLTSPLLQKSWGGWRVAHELAVLPDPENYHLPLFCKLALRLPRVSKKLFLPSEDH